MRILRLLSCIEFGADSTLHASFFLKERSFFLSSKEMVETEIRPLDHIHDIRRTGVLDRSATVGRLKIICLGIKTTFFSPFPSQMEQNYEN